MPIRLPKGFSRRKSSGDVLVESLPTPSFRVLSREEVQSSTGTGRQVNLSDSQFNSTLQKWKVAEVDEDEQFSNLRKSSGAVSRSSALYDTSSSSARLSSSSTLPSSADIETVDHSSLWKKRWRNKTFDESRLSASSRLYSASDIHGSTIRQPQPAEESLQKEQNRNSRMDMSSHAEPTKRSSFPKLDSNIDLGASDLGDLFSNLGERDSVQLRSPAYKFLDPLAVKSESTPVFPTRTLYDSPSLHTPPPIPAHRSQEFELSPHSWTSENSDDKLILRSDPVESPYSSNEHNTSSNPASPILLNSRKRPKSEWSANRGMRSGKDGHTPSMVDEDAQLVRRSVIRRSGDVKLNYDRENDKPGYNGASLLESAKTYESKLQANGTSDHTIQDGESMSINTPSNYPNIAEPADFNRRRFSRSNTEPITENDLRKSSYSLQSETHAEANAAQVEDEETVFMSENTNAINGKRRSREQRKKEADMIVYRQQMEKIGGVRLEVSTAQDTPQIERISVKPPDLYHRLSGNAVNDNEGKSDEDGDEDGDEDDDYEIPLAVLQAHGFPNRSRPPSKPIGSASSFVLRPPDPTDNKSTAKRTSPVPAVDHRQSQLPPFAKHLPQDPYAPSNSNVPHLTAGDRSSYARRSTTSIPSRTGHSLAGIPTGGLVGVIADEERARALRRGTPNAFGGYGQSPLQTGSQMGYMAGDPGMQSNSDALVQQLSQNMLMLQAQMQQMMYSQMNASQQTPVGMMNAQAAAADSSGYFPANGRPASFVSGAPSINSANWHIPNTRASIAVSNFSPASFHSPASVPHIETYAPSIAPSERSNVGLSARYRPVSNHFGKLSSSFLSVDQADSTANGGGRKSASPTRSSIGAAAYEERSSNNSTPTNSTFNANNKSASDDKRSTIRAVERVKASSRKGSDCGAGESDSDSEGWASMKKKRQSKIQLRASAH